MTEVPEGADMDDLSGEDQILDTIDANNDGADDTLLLQFDDDEAPEAIFTDSDGDGRIDSGIIDTDGSGVADVYVLDREEDGSLDQISYDLDRDGVIDVGVNALGSDSGTGGGSIDLLSAASGAGSPNADAGGSGTTGIAGDGAPAPSTPTTPDSHGPGDQPAPGSADDAIKLTPPSSSDPKPEASPPTTNETPPPGQDGTSAINTRLFPGREQPAPSPGPDEPAADIEPADDDRGREQGRHRGRDGQS
jgi:hypothetical protein